MCAGYVHIPSTVYWQQLAAIESSGKEKSSDKKPLGYRYVHIFPPSVLYGGEGKCSWWRLPNVELRRIAQTHAGLSIGIPDG